jgi:hypothetical protein
MDYKAFFRKYACKTMNPNEEIKYPVLEKPSKPKSLHKETPQLSLYHEAKSTDPSVSFADRTSTFTTELNPQLVALFLHFGFDAEEFCGSQTFALWPHGQPKGNNRAIRLTELWNPDDSTNPGFINFFSSNTSTLRHNEVSVVSQKMVLIPYKVCNATVNPGIEDTVGEQKMGELGYLTSMLDCPSNSMDLPKNTFNGSFVDSHYAIGPSTVGLVGIWEKLTVS